MLQLNHKIVKTPASRQFHLKVESFKATSRLVGPRIFITCAGLSTAGVVVYFATQKSPAFCKEALLNENDFSQNDEKSDNKDKCTEKSLYKTNYKSVWSVICSFLKPDLVWFMLAIPVIFYHYFICSLNVFLNVERRFSRIL